MMIMIIIIIIIIIGNVDAKILHNRKVGFQFY